MYKKKKEKEKASCSNQEGDMINICLPTFDEINSP